jgi:hypothetical protein
VNVGEVIKLLSVFDKELPVMLHNSDYEFGPSNREIKGVTLGQETEWIRKRNQTKVLPVDFPVVIIHQDDYE